ncbi:MAG: FGGY family carbohydrate kinase [Armatimonadetes bacterium]|nr:FGGY family carbohydrate kinase [Armatimonadota bacterium]
MSYLGLDVGTTGCKAVVFDEDGKQISLAYREYPLMAPHESWAELDSSLVLGRCVDVIREAAAACPDDPVRGMCVSSQGEAFTPVGSKGEILGNAMVSSDARAASITQAWAEEFGREKLYQKTGHTAHPIYTLFKLLWLRDNQPEVWRNAGSFHCFEDLVHRGLGLEPAISWPLAGRTMMFNVITHDWDEEILSAIALDRSKLARPLASGAVVGRIPNEVAQEIGLPDGVVVVAGGHDQTCGALGAGIASADRAVYGMGTVECITPAFSEPVFTNDLMGNNLATYDYTVKGMYTTVAFSITGGNLLKWFNDEFGHPEAEQSTRTSQSSYELLLGKMPEEPTGLMVLPYFTPSGTPHFDSRVKGCILGLRLTSKREEILKALLEGVSFEMRLNVDILSRSGIDITELVAIGGGARSRTLLQLKADVLGIRIRRAAVTEAGCLGAAMLACAAHTGEDVRTIARKWVRITDVIEPDTERASHYNDRFRDYLKLYPTLKGLF